MSLKLVSSLKPRGYQESIFAKSMNKNSLIILPTGLGKTIIALMLSVYHFNNNSKKILFLAPTKPLVEQQCSSFKSSIENSNEYNFQVLTGLVSPTKREKIYTNSDFIFSTPQLIENDIINGIIKIEEFGFVVFDEAHRATGGYAYCFIAQEFSKKGISLIGLTASPGTSKEEIENVMENLSIENLVVKKYDDVDVKEHTNKTQVTHVEVELNNEIKQVKELLDKTYIKRLDILKSLGVIDEKKAITTKRDLLDLQRVLRAQIAQNEQSEVTWKAISVAAGLMKLQYGQELLESQDIGAAYIYFHNFFRSGGDTSKAAQELIVDINFRDAYGKLRKIQQEGVLHPKLIKLKELVQEEFSKNKELKIIVFNQYRESAQTLVRELNKIKNVKSALFVGQTKKGEVKMSQKQQKQLLDEFREGNHNILVSTSVGEEGLDIPKVDVVIFYEPIPSAIRSIQRLGRTGRFNKGKGYVLQTKGTRDIVTRHIANAKEKRMYKVLDELQREQSQQKNSLTSFIKEEDTYKKIEGKDERIPVLIDNRENTDLIKELYKSEVIKVEAKQLEVGDIVITQDIAIERKSKQDFVNSIIDKRLFPQLIDLARNYKRPILLLEGEENIYSIRNLNPNVIRATLSAISVELRIPILNTQSLYESAQMITTIAKRTNKEKKDISLVAQKSGHSEDQELEKFISSIPRINSVIAKGLLKHFESIENLVKASESKLQEVEGIGALRAKGLKEFFKRKYSL